MKTEVITSEEQKRQIHKKIRFALLISNLTWFISVLYLLFCILFFFMNSISAQILAAIIVYTSFFIFFIAPFSFFVGIFSIIRIGCLQRQLGITTLNMTFCLSLIHTCLCILPIILILVGFIKIPY